MESLKNKGIRDLRVIARKYKVKNYSRMRKENLEKAILEAMEKEKMEKTVELKKEVVEFVKPPQYPADIHYPKFDTLEREKLLGDEEEIPQGYSVERLSLHPRDPEWLFSYWEIKPETIERVGRGMKYPRCILRVYHDYGTEDENINVEGGRHYFRAKFPDITYRVELGLLGKDGEFRKILSSEKVQIPSSTPSKDASAKFITVPYDIPLSELKKGKALKEGRYIGPDGSILSEEEYLKIIGEHISSSGNLIKK